MCDSEAEKILFILNKHERAYRRLIPVYIFLAIVLWILPILLIIYLYFCIVDNEFLRIGFCIAWTAYYFLSLFKYFVKYFFPLDREDLLNLMDLAKDSPDAKQELLERLLSGKRMTGRDEMDIKRILKTKEALDNIRNFIDKQQLTNNDTPKKSTVPNEDKKAQDDDHRKWNKHCNCQWKSETHHRTGLYNTLFRVDKTTRGKQSSL